MQRNRAMRQLRSIEKLVSKSKQPRLAVEWSENWKSLIATILSSQTRDTTTVYICENFLFKKYPSLKALSQARTRDVKKTIKPINFHKTKAKHIIETSKIIIGKWKGKIPNSREKLMTLPGVGRKVANVYLVQAHNQACIGVDTHLTFLSQVLGWTKNKTQIKIEKDLEALFPKKYWNSINYILVRFGQIFPSRKKQVEILKENKLILQS